MVLTKLTNPFSLERGSINQLFGGIAKSHTRALAGTESSSSVGGMKATHLVIILLEKTGQYLVLEENNSTKAYRSARIFRPDLILLDVIMPIRDGGEIAAQIRADPELQNTPIIFLTALVTPSEAKAGVHIDGHPFLAKPINIQELIRTIDEHLFAQEAKLFG